MNFKTKKNDPEKNLTSIGTPDLNGIGRTKKRQKKPNPRRYSLQEAEKEIDTLESEIEGSLIERIKKLEERNTFLENELAKKVDIKTFEAEREEQDTEDITTAKSISSTRKRVNYAMFALGGVIAAFGEEGSGIIRETFGVGSIEAFIGAIVAGGLIVQAATSVHEWVLENHKKLSFSNLKNIFKEKSPEIEKEPEKQPYVGIALLQEIKPLSNNHTLDEFLHTGNPLNFVDKLKQQEPKPPNIGRTT